MHEGVFILRPSATEIEMRGWAGDADGGTVSRKTETPKTPGLVERGESKCPALPWRGRNRCCSSS